MKRKVYEGAYNGYATEKQVNYLLDLYNKLNGTRFRFLSQTDLPLTQRERRGGMTRIEAAAYISELRQELERNS